MVIIIGILLSALMRFPSTIETAISYERGLKAESECKYVTAMKEYAKVVNCYPDSTLAVARLFITQCNNEKIDQAYKSFEIIAGRTLDKNLVNEVNGKIERIETLLIPKEELYELINAYSEKPQEELIKVLEGFLGENPDDVLGAYYLANILFDMGKYDEAEDIMNKVLITNQDFYNGHLLMAATYREKGQYEKAIDCCNRVLSFNKEHACAYASLSKIELKQHNDQKGLEYAKKAYELDWEDSYIVANLSLAYHYNGLLKERDETFTLLKNLNDGNTYDLDLLDAIFSGKLKWRE